MEISDRRAAAAPTPRRSVEGPRPPMRRAGRDGRCAPARGTNPPATPRAKRRSGRSAGTVRLRSASRGSGRRSRGRSWMAGSQCSGLLDRTILRETSAKIFVCTSGDQSSQRRPMQRGTVSSSLSASARRSQGPGRNCAVKASFDHCAQASPSALATGATDHNHNRTPADPRRFTSTSVRRVECIQPCSRRERTSRRPAPGKQSRTARADGAPAREARQGRRAQPHGQVEPAA
jgi:hypothetical protein